MSFAVECQAPLVDFQMFHGGRAYDSYQAYNVHLMQPDDIRGLTDVAMLDAAIFAGHRAFDVSELQHIADPNTGFVVAVSDKDGLVAEAQVVTRATDELPDPLVHDMPPQYAYRAGIGVAPHARDRGLGSMVIGICEDIIRVRYPDKTAILSSCRPENGRNLRNITKLGAIGVDLRTEYYPHQPVPGQEWPPTLYRHTGARLLMYRPLHRPAESFQRASPECQEVSTRLGSEPDIAARRRMDRLFGAGLSLTGIARGDSPQTFLAHFCRTSLRNQVLLPPFHTSE